MGGGESFAVPDTAKDAKDAKEEQNGHWERAGSDLAHL
jgi:hypothetical protein